MILVSGVEATWFTGINKNHGPIILPSEVTGSYIKTALNAGEPVQFLITTLDPHGNLKVLPMPAYILNNVGNVLSIDIGELMAGITLEIALPSGHITVKESK